MTKKNLLFIFVALLVAIFVYSPSCLPGSDADVLSFILLFAGASVHHCSLWSWGGKFFSRDRCAWQQVKILVWTDYRGPSCWSDLDGVTSI